MSYQKVRLGSNASGECFLANTVSSRSNGPSRDRGATRERITVNNVSGPKVLLRPGPRVNMLLVVRLSDRDIATK